jgi:hypothetical protein
MQTPGEFSTSRSKYSPDKKVQTIILVGAEGGAIELAGIEETDRWLFCVRTSNSFPADSLDEGGLIKRPRRSWVRTWRGALKQLDVYPWTQLYPLEVHYAFRSLVGMELKARMKNPGDIDWNSWDRVLSAGVFDDSLL